MKAVVTGHRGLIGQNLSNKLMSINFEVLGIGRDEAQDCSKDITDFNPDIVFHFGAEIYESQSMMENNVVMTKQIFDAAAKTHCQYVIYCGSSSEYGRLDHAMKETDEMNPSTMYELTKSMGTLIAKYSSNVFDYKVRVIRPFSVYGPYDKPRKLIPNLFRAYKQKTSIRIVPEPVHDWIYIDDFIEGVLKTTTLDDKFDIINIGTGIQTSNKAVVETFELVADHKFDIEYTASLRGFDSNCWLCDPTHAKTRYNIKAETNLVTGLQKYIDFMNHST